MPLFAIAPGCVPGVLLYRGLGLKLNTLSNCAAWHARGQCALGAWAVWSLPDPLMQGVVPIQRGQGALAVTPAGIASRQRPTPH